MTPLDLTDCTDAELDLIIRQCNYTLEAREEARDAEAIKIANSGRGRCVGCDARNVGDCSCPGGGPIRAGDWVWSDEGHCETCDHDAVAPYPIGSMPRHRCSPAYPGGPASAWALKHCNPKDYPAKDVPACPVWKAKA